jgi:putative nucleotidyltransferase with HDIG domain
LSVARYKVDQYTVSAIKATRDFDVEDATGTAKRRQDAAAAVLPVFDHDTQANIKKVNKLADVFNEMRSYIEDNPSHVPRGRNGAANTEAAKAAWEEQEARFAQSLGVTPDRRILDYLAKNRYSPDVEADIRDMLNYALTRLIVPDTRILTEQLSDQAKEKAVILREIGTKKERTYTNLDAVLDLAKVQDQVERRARQYIEDFARRAAVLQIAGGLISPTLNFSLAATEERRTAARDEVAPSIIHFRRNQLIVGEGQQITAEHMHILGAMQEGAGATEAFFTFLAVAALLTVLLVTTFRFAHRYIRKFKPTMRDYAFLLATMVMAAILLWLAKWVSLPLVETYDWLTNETIRYLLPLAGFGMLIRFLLYSEAALVWTALMTPVAGLVMDSSLGYALFFMAGALVGAHQIGQAQGSGRFLRAGLLIGATNMVVALTVQVIRDPASLPTLATLANVIGAGLGGLLAGPFALAAVYPLEFLFGYTSNLRLMELANLNHPLLGRMLVEAPGTYHHSLMVSALAEKGAEAIGANPLLAKVAGLYHDVGKVAKPHYFIENQMEDHNPHDDLDPHMSSLVLISHVREGLDLARRHRLGARVERIIAEHHGKSRINYFFNRAKQQETADLEKVSEEDFRYRGPYPQSKESALVMLGDVVEAATRTLKQPTPARIETAVAELIGSIYNDGQLDECEMTLKDLHRVAQQFSTILAGRYHGRIEYPEKEQPKKGKVVTIPAQPAPDGGPAH